jgi:hypothetical protein
VGVVNTLVSTTDLLDFPGAPFLSLWVDIAAASVRAEAGWHIAPEVTETITVESWGGRELFLPSRRVVSVATVGTYDEWSLYPGEMLYRRGGWPVGRLSVTLTHGYAQVPVDLLPLIAARAASASKLRDPAVSTLSVGQVQTSYFRPAGPVATADPVLARYSVRVGVA